jgi:hypothetical protein
MSEQRLRSETIPSAGRVARVRESRARAQRERAAMAEDFRERLTAELAIDGSASQELLIDAAVSLRVELSVVFTRFLGCCATSTELDRLQQSRNQLNRILAALGITPKPPKDARSSSALTDYLKQTYGEAVEEEQTDAAGR